MTEVVDGTRRLLEKKFSKRYQTDAPIELLAYDVGAPPPHEAEWRAEVLASSSSTLARQTQNRGRASG